MAKLVGRKGRHGILLLELILYPDPNSFDWITYEINIKSIEDNEKNLLRLSSSEDYTLFFEARYEPEIPDFCAGILDVVSGKKSNFFFEPIDEKDFQFEIRKMDDELFLLSLYSDNFRVLEQYNWDYKSYLGVKTYVSKEEVLNFVKQLKKEYEEIISKYPKEVSYD